MSAFSNRDGGYILLGVKDDGTLTGIESEATADRLIMEFVTSVNNAQKISPPIYLNPKKHIIDGKIIIVIYVPEGSQICRHGRYVFDRNGDADIDITDNTDLMYRLYSKKSNSYFVNKVTRFSINDLRRDLIARARKMAVHRKPDHPWGNLSDKEILRSVGLLQKRDGRGKYGATVAAVLLFGKDETIMAALTQHKSDAIFRVNNLDRYDDREVIITNLFDTYDRMLAFGQKHLNDNFVLEGLSVSASGIAY